MKTEEKNIIYSGDFTLDKKKDYLHKKVPEAPENAFAILDNETWEKKNGEWDFVSATIWGTAKQNHEEELKDTKEVFAKNNPIVVIELSKEYIQYMDNRIKENRIRKNKYDN
jgi:hypothetical protein